MPPIPEPPVPSINASATTKTKDKPGASNGQPRACASLVLRWLELTQQHLPAMADAQRWPIRLDHCLMRVCLDAAFGQPWHQAVARPAIRHASAAELSRAIAVAESILAAPDTLPALNHESLLMRGKRARSPAQPVQANGSTT